MVWDAHWVLRAALIAIVGALLGGLYPALRAAQKDPDRGARLRVVVAERLINRAPGCDPGHFIARLP